MKYSHEQLLAMRGGILIQLNAADPRPLPAPAIRSNLSLVSGFRGIDETTVDEQLRYLERKGRIERERNDDAIRAYFITDEGRVWLDEHELL